MDPSLGAGELSPWEQVHYWRDPTLPLPSLPLPVEEEKEEPLRFPADDNALLGAMSQAELDALIAQYRERRKFSDPETAGTIDVIITELEQLKIVVSSMEQTMTYPPGKVSLTQHIPLQVEVPPGLAEQYPGMEMFPTSELVQHQFAIVALDQSVMTVVYVSGPTYVDTWVVFEYSVGTGKILATMGVDTYQEREKAKAGEPGLEATLSPIDYLIFAGIAGPSVLRSMITSHWGGLLKAKAISSGVNVVAQGAADYAFTGELDYTNLAVAATVGWASGGLPPGPTGRLTSGLLGVAGAGTADVVNYEQGQSVDPLNGLNLQLVYGSNMLGHALDQGVYGRHHHQRSRGRAGVRQRTRRRQRHSIWNRRDSLAGGTGAVLVHARVRSCDSCRHAAAPRARVRPGARELWRARVAKVRARRVTEANRGALAPACAARRGKR